MDLLAKLQIKDPASVSLHRPPQDLLELFTDAGLSTRDDQAMQKGLICFCHTKKEARETVDDVSALSQDALCWIVYPKQSGRLDTDITRDDGWQPFEERGWLPVRLVSINDDWSALRFRPKSQIKKLQRGTDYPGIDREKKTVALPEDLVSALAPLDLVGKFEALSFSQRRELVIGILDAKKPETRMRRIDKVLQLFTGD